MKNLFNNLFFGYFPYGWRRLFRTIMFVLFVVCSLGAPGRYENIKVYYDYRHPVWSNEWITGFLFGFIVLMLLSYIITGFIKQKNPNL